jgi:uncharacterized protein (TIGR02996 family)
MEGAMNERDALLRAVCANPDDDTPRLMFADWLQEHGEEDRAEFIRAQVVLARGTAHPGLKVREQALLDAHRGEWEQPFRRFEVAGSFRQFVYDIHFRRGFVWGLDINDEEQRFANHARELFGVAPVQRIAFFHKWQHADLARCPELLRVRELSIDRAGFETAELEALLRVPFLVNINRLELIADDDNGHLAPDGIELLSRTSTLPALRHLDLSHNWCGWEGDDHWVETLTTGGLIGQLESLSLRGTFIEDDGAQTLARCERLHALTSLDLAVNMIGDRGLRALAASPHLSRLKVLDLRHNLYDTDAGIQAKGCTPETRRILVARFGERILIDGRLDG